jgi:mono/diheme cytochrome c family protein
MDAYADLADDDLVAILSFLRSLPPRSGTPPRTRINLLGKLTLAYFLDPYAPDGPPPAHLDRDASSAYGGYLANTLAGCRTCHTARNLRTGAYTSPSFSGGLSFHSRLNPGQVYVSPNLTPDPATGRLTGWTEDAFVARFRAGLLLPDSPMPWGSFRRMTDDDLRAAYRYLRALAPVHHDVGPVLQAEHGQAAG